MTRNMCFYLFKHCFYAPKILEIPKKWWLRPNVTEKLLTGTLSIKNKFRSQLQLFYYLSTIYVKLCFHFYNKRSIAKIILTSFNILLKNILRSILHFEIR